MKNIVIYTPYNCVVKTDNRECFLNINEHLVLEESINKVYIYPTGKSERLAFSIDLKSKSSNFYSKIEKDDKILIFLLDGLLAENIDCFTFNYKGKTSQIDVGKEQIAFITQNHRKIITLNSPSNINCGNFFHINYALLDNVTQKQLICYNTLTNKAKIFIGNDIELKENGFKVIKNNFESYDEIIEEYIITQDGLKEKNKTFAQSERLIPESLTSYYFMNAIKNNDYTTALSYLDNSLKKSLDDKLLKNYFGDISYFYLIDSNTCFAISNNKNTLYEFTTTDNKISEINDYN